MAATDLVRPTGWRRLLALHPRMVDFGRRGFRTEPAATRDVLQDVAGTFLDGFNRELAARDVPDLSGVRPAVRGFAVEGAAMAAALLDTLRPVGGRRLAALTARYGEHYDYLIHVGVGWARAKLRRRGLGGWGSEAPLLRWLGYDGMGFCQAFFADSRRLRSWSRHPGSCPPECAIRYQGLGRSLWFRACGEPGELAAYVSGLPVAHHGDAWSGIALAAAYAGGVKAATYERIRDAAGASRAAVAQGAAFAAEAWRRSGHLPPHARTGIPVLTGVSPEQAAAWTWQVRRDLDRPGAGADDYQRWRLGVQRLAARHGPLEVGR